MEQPPAWRKGRCHDGEKHHTPVPARMCPTTFPPWLAAAWPCQTTITSQVKWGAFLACTGGCCEEPYLPISNSKTEGAWQEDGWHRMEVGKFCHWTLAMPGEAARKGWRATT